MTDAFAPASAHPSAQPLFAGAAMLDAEKLDCYRIALEPQFTGCWACGAERPPEEPEK